MFCSSCGKPIPNESHFCLHCGARVAVVAEGTETSSPSSHLPAHKEASNAVAGAPNRTPPSTKDRPSLQFVLRSAPAEQPRKNAKRRKSTAPPEQPRVRSEAQLREEAAWKQVEDTGKPVLFEGKWLIPVGMSLWDGIELLPDDIRDQVREAVQRRVADIYIGLVQKSRERLRQLAVEQGTIEQFDELQFTGQMAVAESVMREQLGAPEIPMDKLVARYLPQQSKTKRGKSSSKRERTS